MTFRIGLRKVLRLATVRTRYEVGDARPSLPPVTKSPPTQQEWLERAADSWRAANRLGVDAKVPLKYSAASRLYYSAFQGAKSYVAVRHPDIDPQLDHGQFWSALQSHPDANLVKIGLLLSTLYSYRRKADYAADTFTIDEVRTLINQSSTSMRTMGVIA